MVVNHLQIQPLPIQFKPSWLGAGEAVGALAKFRSCSHFLSYLPEAVMVFVLSFSQARFKPCAVISHVVNQCLAGNLSLSVWKGRVF